MATWRSMMPGLAALLLLAGLPCRAGEIAPQALAEALARGEVAYLLDVRTPEEFAQGHIAGAINIPVDGLEHRLAEIPAQVPVTLYCRSGRRAGIAAALLEARGHATTELGGSILAWEAAGLPVVAPAAQTQTDAQ